MSKINIRLSVLVALITVAAFSRVIPHIFNFSPLGAIGLFGAAYFAKRWQALLIPLAATWLSDLFINNVVYSQHYIEFTWFYPTFIWQYSSYIMITLWGLLVLRKVNPGRVFAGALGASVIFFLISNLGNWPGNPFYSHKLNEWPGSPVYSTGFGGLLSCYVAGLPFIKGTILGDLFYSCSLFGAFALLQARFPVLAGKRRQDKEVAVSR